MFIGEHIAKLDDKGRLVFPSPFKAFAEREGEGKLGYVLKKNLFLPCLDMYTYEEWKRQSAIIRVRLNNIPFSRKQNVLWNEYMNDSAIVEPDEKMGRIMIPKRLLEKIDARREVVFSGKDFKIEVWASEHQNENRLSESEYLALVEEILG